MAEFSLAVGNSESNLLETAVVLSSIANILQWCFFIMIVLSKLHNRKENATNSKKTHSQNKHRKER